jgi:peptidoglycan/LPS O-acetylase OafA/YrhL
LGLLFLLLVSRRTAEPFRLLPWVFLVLAPLLLGLRALNFATRHYMVSTHHWPTHLRIDSLFFGVLLSYFFHFRRAAWASLLRWRWLLLPLSVLLLVPSLVFALDDFVMNTVGLTCLYLGFGGLLIVAVAARSSLLGRPVALVLAYIGAHSYSIYLWHGPAHSWLPALLRRLTGSEIDYAVEIAVSVVGAVGLGIVMAKLIELPVLHLRDRFFPSGSNGPLRITPSSER